MAVRSADAKMNKVHQDDDYIYPALGKYLLCTFFSNSHIYPPFTEASDDEDIPLQKDDAWNPKSKMSRNTSKLERPTRDSAKNVAIEKGLKIASEKSKVNLKLRRTGGDVHKVSKPKQTFKPLDVDFSSNKNRPKKAGSTAKQRLGKLLGLKF